jgi:hypothetical protein
MSRRRHNGPTLAVAVFSLFGGFFFCLVGYCAAGWWGVLGTVVFVWLVALVLRSEVTRSRERQRRADDEWVRYYTAYAPPPQRRGRRTRGGGR